MFDRDPHVHRERRGAAAGAAACVASSLLLLALGAAGAHASGTPACTEIANRASATYTIGDDTFTQTSNTVVTRVAEVLDVVVSWQDAGSVVVSPAATGEVLTFLVTNIGNGTESYALTGAAALPGDDFDPTPVALFLDGNGNGTYDPGLDLAYVPGVNDPVLAADSSVVVFAANDIPGGLLDGDTGDFRLIATSRTGSGAPGTVLDGEGDCGTNAVVGNSGGTDLDDGTYLVSGVVVTLRKTAVVSDPFGGTEPVPGAVIVYTIVVTIGGVGIANDLTITDPVPPHTTYLAGSITLDALALTDAMDADAGNFGATSANTVTVLLGDVPAGVPDMTITFTVTID